MKKESLVHSTDALDGGEVVNLNELSLGEAMKMLRQKKKEKRKSAQVVELTEDEEVEVNFIKKCTLVFIFILCLYLGVIFLSIFLYYYRITKVYSTIKL